MVNPKYIRPLKENYLSFRLYENIYFFGTKQCSTHVVDTGDGLVMLDAGYHHFLHLLFDGMYSMGLNPRDVKYLLLTHGHIDHFGGARALRDVSGCKIALGERDRLYANGELDLSWAKELGLEYNENFEPDIIVNHGDKITCGTTTFRAFATPGHTPGAMTWFFNTCDGKTAALHGGMGSNSMKKVFLDEYGLSYDCRDEFIKAMDELSCEKCDIYLGNHTSQNDTEGKYKRILEGDKDAFVDSEALKISCLNAKKAIMEMVERGE